MSSARNDSGLAARIGDLDKPSHASRVADQLMEMSLYVVDCSVAVKWYVPERYTKSAVRLLDERNSLHVPDLLLAEFGNSLWKKHRRGELTVGEVRSILKALWAVPLEIHSSEVLLEGAVDVALHAGRTVYDSLYVAMAMLLDCPVIMADDSLVRALQPAGLSPHVRHVSLL